MVKQSMDASSWNAWVAQQGGSLLQTTLWGQLKADFGWSWELVTAEENRSGALLLYRPLPLHLGTIAYVPRGPVVDWQDPDAVDALFVALRRTARRRGAWALWVEPDLFDTPEHRARLHLRGLRPTAFTIQPPRTILVDLSADEETILGRMHQKTRYNIRLAARKGVTVREGTLADCATFYALMQETGSRDAFGIHSAAYYRRAFELFSPTGQVALLLAEVEGEPVAGLMVFAWGPTAWYFYGASSNRHREKMAPYALQWAALQWAQRRGCTTYDLWGIPDADEATLEAEFAQRQDGLWGVYRFKRGFGGRVTRYAGLWEQALHPLYPLAARLWRRRRGE